MNTQEIANTAYAEAARKENERLRAILTHPVAKAVPTLAEHYAYAVQEEAETAIKAMKAAAGWVDESPIEKEAAQ